jgi:alpha-beta hydrolase superfamily lysophospholipase
VNWKRILIGKWSWKRPFISLLWIYVMLGVVAVFFGDRLLFVPPVPSYARESKELVRLTTSAGEQIDAFHFSAAPGMPTLLYSHGNAEDIGQGTDLYQEWRSMGFGVLAYEFPGYGHSTGTATESSCQRAIHTAWQHLIRSGVNAGSVVIVGRSVGGGPSTWLASTVKSAGLVLIAPFTSVYSVAFRAPIFPRDRFSNLKRIRGMDTPLLVIHGENDEVIPVSHGRKLVEASLAKDKHFSMVAGARHNDLFEIAGEDIIRQVADFARRVKRQ